MKCVLITGGAGGIGLGCASYFAGKGWSVFIADINGGSMSGGGAQY
ncbi:MAG: hypothetical protein LRY51_01205 [Geovibrio sp.]|nr:hypothetical protein [Geovibrio sp.]